MKVKDLMIPLADYATVPEQATLREAILALEEAQKKQRLEKGGYRHRAVIVVNAQERARGKLSMWDILKALEPRYDELIDFKTISKDGFSGRFIRSMIDHHGLWQKPLDNLCEMAARIQVKDIMYTPAEGEYVDQEASLNEGIHQLIMGRHQSLLVTKGRENEVVGVLRLTDVFSEICRRIKENCP